MAAAARAQRSKSWRPQRLCRSGSACRGTRAQRSKRPSPATAASRSRATARSAMMRCILAAALPRSAAGPFLFLLRPAGHPGNSACESASGHGVLATCCYAYIDQLLKHCSELWKLLSSGSSEPGCVCRQRWWLVGSARTISTSPALGSGGSRRKPQSKRSPACTAGELFSPLVLPSFVTM